MNNGRLNCWFTRTALSLLKLQVYLMQADAKPSNIDEIQLG